MRPSDRARALIEALHEPTSNEERWTIAERFLREEYDAGIACGRNTVDGPATLVRALQSPEGIAASKELLEEAGHGLPNDGWSE